jgi:succinate-semialdehyde dehydrogenase/glutarate-semialdehyde dehydrogenase
MPLTSVNPTTGETIRSYPELSAAEVDRAAEAAHRAFLGWRETSFAERAALMRRAAGVLRDEREDHARRMALEMGKPLAAGRAEVDKCAWVCEHYAAHAEALLAPEPVESDATRSYVAFQPLGAVLAVMPWNFPFWQVFRFAAPNLMAGNAGLLKHAANVSGCSLAIAGVFRRAGFPEGLFQSLLIGSPAVSALIAHPRVRAVTLTGSTPAGRAVASAAGAELKKTVLELGGSDPYLILEDADLDEAVATCVASRLVNGGQSCIAAKRFIVPPAILAVVEERFVARMAAARVGDPLDPETEVGPLARRDLRDDLHHQVEESLRRGARLLLGGVVPEGPGAFYPPTVLAGVRPGMPAADEELFGPVAAILPAAGEEDALRLADASPFGLGAAVFGRDAARAEALAARIEAGSCFVNGLVKSDPRLPFGGVKESGYGRELGSFGIREFVNVRTVWVK